MGAMSDAMVAVALAGSIFFSIDPSAARWRVALYLVLTIAPFAVVTPLIGPLIDRARGGRRGMIWLTVAGRVVLAYLMTRHIDGLLLFPEAFGFLILQKSYSVAKSAVVPNLVRSELELVEANSKLTLLSAVSSMVGAGIGGLALLVGPTAPPWVAVVGFIVTLGYATQLPKVAVAVAPATAGERADLRSGGILLAASAMALLRASVGFLTFLLAFEFRGGEEGLSLEGVGRAAGAAAGLGRGQDIFGSPGAPAWHFGVVMVAAGCGALLGAQLAPRLRRRMVEEHLLIRVLFVAMLGGVTATFVGPVLGAVILSAVVAATAGSGKLAFDSLVQRDAPDANHGRSFAGFEARFQLMWAVGAFIPVVVPLPVELGYAVVAGGLAFAWVSYLIGTRAARRAATPPTPDRPDGQLPFWSRDDTNGDPPRGT